MVWDSSDGNLEFADNAKATLGTGDDLEIYFDSSNSVIHHTPTGSGELQLRSRIFKVHSADNSEAQIKATENAAVELFFNGVNKFQTKADGANVTGELECDYLDVDGGFNIDNGQLVFEDTNNRLDFADNAKATFGAYQDMEIHHDTNNSVISNKTGSLFIKGLGGSGNAIIMQPKNNEMSAKFNPDAGVELFFDHSEKFETTAYGTNTIGTVSYTHLTLPTKLTV